jgi:hypothetical protein
MVETARRLSIGARPLGPRGATIRLLKELAPRTREPVQSAVELPQLTNLASNKFDLTSISAVDRPRATDLHHIAARRLTISLGAGLLILFTLLAWSAVVGKSPTADEGYHALAGWLHWRDGDYRFDCEDPPLWNTLAAAIAGSNDIRVDLPRPDWSHLPLDGHSEYLWQIQMLYRTPGNDATAFVNRFRAVMLFGAVMMGAFLAAFVWRMALAIGMTSAAAGAAAVFSMGLLAFDPNFLAHAPLMKNDVASSFAMLALTASTYTVGRALTSWRVLLLGICSGIAMTVKYNGPLLIEASATLLLLRSVAPWPWWIGVRAETAALCTKRLKRIVAAAATVAVMLLMTFGAIWLSYALRSAPTRSLASSMEMTPVVHACQIKRWQAERTDGHTLPIPSVADLPDMPRPMIVQLASWANQLHVLPQSFLAGLLYVYQSAQVRQTFLCGEVSSVGRWWYFPFAMAVKTPVATLVAFAAAAILSSVLFLANTSRQTESDSRPDPAGLPIKAWTALCLGVPVVIYLGAAMSANLNLGVRHVLPIYPLLFAGAGLAMACYGLRIA